MLRIWLIAIMIMAGLAGFIFSFDQAYRRVVGLMDQQGTATVTTGVKGGSLP